MDKSGPEKVHHNVYGDGEVIKLATDKIYVMFGEKLRIFPYPDALEKGYLSALKNLINSGKNLQDECEELTPENIKHRLIVIKINQRYEDNMNAKDLYNSVRGIWKASKERAEKAEYVLGVYQSRIVAVYKPTEWYVCKEAKDRLPRFVKKQRIDFQGMILYYHLKMRTEFSLLIRHLNKDFQLMIARSFIWERPLRNFWLTRILRIRFHILILLLM